MTSWNKLKLLQEWTTLAKKSLWAKSTYVSLTSATSSPVTVQDILTALADMLKDFPLKIHIFLAQQQAARGSIQLHKRCLFWITESCPILTGSRSPQPDIFYSDDAQVVILNISVTVKPLQQDCRERCWQISIFQQCELARDETSLLACLQATLTSQHGSVLRQYISERADHELKTWGCPHPL